MAEYIAKTRTNYFCVTNETILQDIVNRMSAEENVELSKKNGQYMFSCADKISGIYPKEYDPAEDEDNEPDYDLMVEELQQILPEGEAIIITETGSEKLRYLVGSACVITATECRFLNIWDAAKNVARELLNDNKWETETTY